MFSWCCVRDLSRAVASILSATAILLVSWRAHAQLAPTGTHYATRSSDTGHDAVGPDGNGEFHASVPLGLPPARGGLPVPVEIVSGTRGFGAAGVGWDIPLSYVVVDDSFAHRRPSYQPAVTATPRERIVAVLPGQTSEMVAQDATHWTARNAPDVSMVSTNGVYQVFDGAGFTYTFVMKPELVGTGANLWLLDTIRGPGASSVKLTYDINRNAVAGSAGPTISIDLTEVDYNSHPTGACFKNSVLLGYEPVATSAAPLALSVVGGAVLVRKHKLGVIDFVARATCDTSTAPVRLLRYTLQYLPDLDNGLSRLSTVTVSGREDTTEANTNIPLAAYSYGSATSMGDGDTKSLFYAADDDITLTPLEYAATGNTARVSAGLYQPPTSDPIYASQQTLTDFTGDGRPDLIFVAGGQLQIARNQPQAGGVAMFTARAPFTDPTNTRQVLDARTSSAIRFAKVPVNAATEEYIWRQAIDVNGDGRMDFIDAGEVPNRWIVYLNKPDSGPSGIKWVRRAIDVTRWRNDFASLGLPVPSNYLPLSRRVSGRDHHYYQCFRWDYSTLQYVEDPGDRGTARCLIDPTAPQEPDGVERTYTDWELVDANGDGYPDLVYNASPFQMVGNRPTVHTTDYVVFPQDLDLKHTGAADIYLALNVAGVALYDDTSPQNAFARASKLLSNSVCGVEEWSGIMVTGKETQYLACGFADVNGDGLLDRVEPTSVLAPDGRLTGASKVYLGTGNGFATTTFDMPSFVSLHQSGYAEKCQGPTPSTFFNSNEINGLRDLTGDGIPDLIYRDVNHLDGGAYVAIGTGAGFAAPMSWNGALLSMETERCDGTSSYTTAGLFDITGDGKPDAVSLTGAAGTAVLHIAELAAGGMRGAPQAGRIVRVDNGAGAVANLSYRSAKEDGTTPHQVPFPEIVVDRVTSYGTHGFGVADDTTSFAYGNTQMFYDSTSDAFRPTGYLRHVAAKVTASQGSSVKAPVAAEIIDRYPFDATWGLGDDDRYMRYQRVGQVSDTNVLSVDASTDVWALLTDELGHETRRMRGSHDVFSGHMVREANAQAAQDCSEILDPFDFQYSLAQDFGSSYTPCSVHGYSNLTDSIEWHGTAAPPAAENVETHRAVLAVDSYGRPTTIFEDGDIHRGDDDLCITLTYAAPSSTDLHIPTRVATKRVSGCWKDTATYAEESYEYDGLSSGYASTGLLTSQTVHPHRGDTGLDLGAIREFDITYDAAANPRTVTTTREDSATRTSTFTYDEFGLAPVRVDVQGSGLSPMTVTNVIDPVTAQVLSSTDATGTTRGGIRDGFDRTIADTIQPPGGAVGVMSTTTYVAFDAPALGRQVQIKTFVDPVPADNVATSPGRVATTFLDELARPRYTQLQLGDDYGNKILVLGARTYDALGRVSFEADPYPVGQDLTTVYGTTQLYSVDGSLDVSIRGPGLQSRSVTPDAGLERFPTVYTHTYADNRETLKTMGPDALTSTAPQFGVTHQATSTATGRVISRATWQSTGRAEYAELAYDHLGQLAAMTRYKDPTTPANPVTWTWQYDSQGHLLSSTEPLNAPQTRTYSNWGELKQVHWAPTSPEPTHDVVYSYDALGRVTLSAEQNGGVVDPDTIMKYGYDTPRVSPIAENLYTLGRLAYTTSPTSETRFGYDAFGNVNASTFLDASDGSTYVEQDSYHADGSRAFIELALPDASYVPERMDYEYDTAGRLRWMWFNDGRNTQELYAATDVDVWGRLGGATFGPSSLTIGYADTGRRLPKGVTLKTLTQTRGFTFNAFDAAGRELSRSYNTPRFTGTETRSYDALGRLSSTNRVQAGLTTAQWNVSYDPLGNVATLGDYVTSIGAGATYRADDPDRICRLNISGSSGFISRACNVTYDSFGNVTNEPTVNGSNRLAFLNSGAVRQISSSRGTTATFRYGAFGDRETLDIVGAGSTVVRSQHDYGPRISKRVEASPSSTASYVARAFPGNGFSVSRRGSQGPWVYEYGDSNGTRFTVDDAGAIPQDVDYTPFGQPTSTGAQLGSLEYTATQWNGGDVLAGIGLEQIGARVYDPVIGRFLSRDPLVVPRTAATTNPYAFAHNDPVDLADPSGMDPCGSDLCISGNSGDSGSSSTVGNIVGVVGWAWNLAFGGSGHPHRQTTISPMSTWVYMPAANWWQGWADITGDPGLKATFQSLADDGYRNVIVSNAIAGEPSVKQWARVVLNLPLIGHAFKAGAYARMGYGTAALKEGGLAGIDLAIQVVTDGLFKLRGGAGAALAEEGEAGASSRLVRGGGLAAHEAAGGHLLARHVAKSEWYLTTRLASQDIAAASTFVTRAEAEAGVSAVLDARAAEIGAWESMGAQGTLPLTAPFDGGMVLARGAAMPVPGTNVFVLLKGDGAGGWFVLTGYPQP